MNLSVNMVQTSSAISTAARQRLLSRWGEPLLIADWQRVLMLHFEVDADALQKAVPFPLDLRDGRAYVSLVAFTLHGMRPFIGGKLTAWMLRPIATHDFLNVRTYVNHAGEPGIHFLAEWLSNRLAVSLGPPTFGLPYRHGAIRYTHDRPREPLSGRVADVRTGAALRYCLAQNSPSPNKFAPCDIDSLDEWLMERYTAFNSAGGRKKFFRIWHPPWPQQPVKIDLLETSLLTKSWPWLAEAQLMGANYSPGVQDVWMGRPHRIG